MPDSLKVMLGIGLAWILLGTGLSHIIGLALPNWLFVWGYSHVFVLLPMVAWLVWQKINDLENPVQGSWVGLIGLAVMQAAYVAAMLLGTQSGMLVLIPVLMWASVWACCGWRVARIAVFPLLLLYLAVPIWSVLSEPLQRVSAIVVKNLLDLSGIPALKTGTLISIPSGNLLIAAACSGLSFVLVALSLGSFYSMAWIKAWRDRLLIAGVCLVVALVANWLRIYGIVVVGHVSEMQHYLIVQDHETYGWVVFFVLMVPVFSLMRRLELKSGTLDHGHASDAAVAASEDNSNQLRPTWLLWCLVALIAAGPVFITPPDQAYPQQPEALGLDLLDNKWHQTGQGINWQPEAAAAFRQYTGSFVASDRTDQIDLFVASYDRHISEARFRQAGQWLRAGWQQVGAIRQVQLASQYPEKVMIIPIQRQNERRLVLFWLDFNGKARVARVPALLQDMLGRLTGQPRSIVALSAACRTDCDTTQRQLSEFVTSVAPEIRKQLMSARSEQE